MASLCRICLLYQKTGTIPNECGQVKDPENGNILRNREYVAGWIKRGPSGVIGTNKQDAVETVHRMLETFLNEKMEAGKITQIRILFTCSKP